MKQIFIINGSGGVGKDTFVELFSKHYKTLNYSSVDKVKEIAKEIGWNGGKTEKDRKFLSDLKLLCTEYNDLPMLCMREIVNHFLHDITFCEDYLFLHIREPEEIEKAKKEFNAVTLLIKRDSVKHITSNMADKNVFDYKYDLVIENNGSLITLEHKAILLGKGLL